MVGIYDRVQQVTNGKLNRAVTHARELSLKLNDFKQFRRRVTLGKKLFDESRRYRVPQDKGYLQFGAEAFGSTAGMVQIGRKMFEQTGRQVLSGWKSEKGKSYLVNILS